MSQDTTTVTPADQAPPADPLQPPTTTTTELPKTGADAARESLMGDKDFWDNLLSDPVPKTEEAKTEDGKDKGSTDEPKKPAEEPKKPAAKRKKAEPAPEPQPGIDANRVIEMATVAATAAARAATPQPQPQTQVQQTQKQTKVDPIEVLGADSKDDIDEMVEMEKLYPDRYRGLLDRYVDFKQSEKDYISKWKKENPGQKFDRDDSSHDSFYENEPEWQEADRRRAQRSIILREAETIAEKKLEPIKSQIEIERAQAKIIPEVERSAQNSFAHILVSLNQEFEQHLSTDDGLKKIEESDPIAIEAAKEAFTEIKGAAVEAVKLWNGAAKLDLRGNQEHAQIARAYQEIERDVNSLPMQQKFDAAGRLFATSQEYNSLPESERQKRWTIGLNEVMYRLSETAAAKAREIHKSRTAAFESYLKRMGVAVDPKKPAVSASQGTPKTPAKEFERPSLLQHPIMTPPSSPRGVASTSTSKPASAPADDFVSSFGTFSK